MLKALFEWFGVGSIAAIAAVTTAPQVSPLRVTAFGTAALTLVLVGRMGLRRLGLIANRRWAAEHLRLAMPEMILEASPRPARREGEVAEALHCPRQDGRPGPDEGRGRSGAVPEPQGPRAAEEPGGADGAWSRGPFDALAIICSRMDEVSYSPGHPNVLAMTKYRPGGLAHREDDRPVSQGVPASELVVSRREDASGAVLEIAGVLDAVGASELRDRVDALTAERPLAVVVDLSGLRMVDSVGVGVIVRLYKRCTAAGATVRVVGLGEQPLAVFRLLRLDRIFSGQ